MVLLTSAVASLLLAPKVSVASDGISVGTLVRELAVKSGQRLEAAPEVAAEPLVVQFRDQDLEAVLTKVAAVTDANWVVVDGVRTLTRPPSMKTDLERDEAKRLTDRLQQMFDAKLTAFAAQPRFDAKAATALVDRYRLAQLKPEELTAEIERVMDGNPITTASVKILAAVGAPALVKLALNERVVYSDVPTAMQRSITARGFQALSELRAGIKLLETAKDQLGSPQRRLVNIAGWPSLGPGKLAQGYGKTLLAVHRTSAIGYRFELTMVASDGRAILRGSGELPSRSRLMRPSFAHQGDALTINPQMKSFAELLTSVGYAHASTRFARLPDGTRISGSFAITRDEQSGRRRSDALSSILSEPTVHEPLGLLVGPMLRQVADARKQPFVGTVPDQVLVDLARMVTQATVRTTDDLVRYLTRDFLPEGERVPIALIEESEGWLSLKPYAPSLTRARRMPRADLEKLLKGIRRSNALTFEQAAEYLRQHPLPSLGSLEFLYLSNVDPGVDQEAVSATMTEGLALLASLRPGQWAAARQGTLDYVSLLQSQREHLRRLVYGHVAYHSLVPASPQDEPFQRASPLTIEPTELLPRGIPSTTRLRLAQHEEPILIARATNGYRYTLTPESVGYLEAMQADPSRHPDAAQRILVDFRPATRSAYALVLHLTPVLEPQLGAMAVRPTSTTYLSKDALPESLRKRIDASKAAFVQSLGSTPPP